MRGIHYDRHSDHVVVITLEGDNDLNLSVVNDDLYDQLVAYRDDDDAWCAVVTGAGHRAFSAGSDMQPMAARGQVADVPAPSVKPLEFLNSGQLWKPLIAAVNGHALGAGLNLALACDMRIAVEHATFGLPEVKLGFPPGRGATHRLPRLLPPGPAMQLLLTGDRMSAEDAYRWGLVNALVSPEGLMAAALDLAGRITANPPLAVRATKELAVRGRDLSFEEGLRLELETSRRVVESADTREALRAFRDKRRPVFKGC
jgi:enoyl-CoA hydratase/carnithine racemase